MSPIHSPASIREVAARGPVLPMKGSDLADFISYAAFGIIEPRLRWHKAEQLANALAEAIAEANRLADGEPIPRCSWITQDRNCRRQIIDGSEATLPLCHFHAEKYGSRIVRKHERERDDLIATARRIERTALDAARIPEADRTVYYVQRPGDDAIKIGVTNDIAKRLGGLRTVAPVVLLATHLGGRPAEQAMHVRFAEHRVDGEWFRPVPELLAHIELVKSRREQEAAAA